ncbi:hypothetical protein ACJJTC_017356 [Scirpophaga incertulas]
MENFGHEEEIRPEHRQNRIEDLHLDGIVASQPEIGPTPPDGGYGWLIVVSAALYNITVPGLLTLYGLVILKAIKQEDHEENEKFRIWDMDLALVPIIIIVMRLLLESWCRAVVKTFHMPRFMALAGLCLTVAGVLLSSYATEIYSNDHIVNIFAGIFAGIGCALTGQQTDVIIKHYFREKLTLAQRLVRAAPSLGNCLMPLLIGYLCTKYQNDVVVMIYAAILMQNCLFLASYTRPIYIEKVIRTTYNALRDAVEDEDEVIYSNQAASAEQTNTAARNEPITTQDEDANDVVVFKSKEGAKEILDPEIQYRDKKAITDNQARFSSDFNSIVAQSSSANRFSSNFGSQEIFDYNNSRRVTFEETTPNRFSSNFGSQDIYSYRTQGYQELESIDRQNPQPLYRETTMNAPDSTAVFPEATPGTARRTASLRKNFITIANMLKDLNFYTYALLHLTNTYSIMILGIYFPAFMWEQNQSLNMWSVSIVVAAAHALAFCFIVLCVMMPSSVNEKPRICAAFAFVGVAGFYGLTLTGNKSLLVLWCSCASFSTAASTTLQQPLHSTINEFDATATITATNLIAASFILGWSLARNYEYQTCFLTASILQLTTALVFLAVSFRKRR